MHRHAIGNRWPPRGVGPGVEVSSEYKTANPPGFGRADLKIDFGGMALGCRLHRFCTAVRHANWLTRFQRRQRQKRLNRQIQFRPKTAANRSGSYPEFTLITAKNCRQAF